MCTTLTFYPSIKFNILRPLDVLQLPVRRCGAVSVLAVNSSKASYLQSHLYSNSVWKRGLCLLVTDAAQLRVFV